VARERGGQRKHAVNQGEGAVENHQRKQRHARPDEGKDAEGDGRNPA
jgi:hypothetical protein